MRYLDTCICIEFLHGRLRYGYQLMREGGQEGFQLPSIVVAELWYGAEHSSNPEKELKVVGTFVDAFEIAAFDKAAAKEYGRIRQLLSMQGNLIGDRDLMIAACALANGATLVTDNVKDFERIPGLRLESWSEVEIG